MWRFNNQKHIKAYMLPGGTVYVVSGKLIIILIMRL